MRRRGSRLVPRLKLQGSSSSSFLMEALLLLTLMVICHLTGSEEWMVLVGYSTLIIILGQLLGIGRLVIKSRVISTLWMRRCGKPWVEHCLVKTRRLLVVPDRAHRLLLV